MSSDRGLKKERNQMKKCPLSGVKFSRSKALLLGAGAAALLSCSTAFAADPPSAKEMWKQIQQNQKAIEATADAASGSDSHGHGGHGWWKNTSIGGYGEVHYNSGPTHQIDVHRFVLFIGHEYSDTVRLFSELEVEHALAGDGKPGEVELEQAWIEFDLNKQTSARAGVFLVPVGILNETHEPPTFYGVERNRVENKIIPSTWWEAGLGLHHTTDNGLRFDFGAHSGLDVPNGTFLPRSGRQKVAEATARTPAFTGRIRYTGIPGLEVATTLQYQADMTQADALDVESEATLFEAHVDYKKPISKSTEFGFRALYAQWDIDGSAADALGRDEQFGYYLEPSVKFTMASGNKVGFFARYSVDDNTAGNSVDTETKEFSIGSNFWPHENVVLKVDYQNQSTPEGTDDADRLNAGVGFTF